MGAHSVPAPLGQRVGPPWVGPDPLPRFRGNLTPRPAMRGGNPNGKASERQTNRRKASEQAKQTESIRASTRERWARAGAPLRVSPCTAPDHAAQSIIEKKVRFARGREARGRGWGHPFGPAPAPRPLSAAKAATAQR